MTTLLQKSVKTTVFTSSGTWTKDPRTKQLLVETLGGGGGSRGGASTNGGTGGTSSFGALLSSAGGTGGAGGAEQAGAAATVAADVFSFPGGVGSYTTAVLHSGDGAEPANSSLGTGGACFFGPPRYRVGSGYGSGGSGFTAAAESNRGCGACTSSINGAGNAIGGGGGAYSAKIFDAVSVADSITITVGAGGTAGTAGFAGGAGLVIVTEFF